MVTWILWPRKNGLAIPRIYSFPKNHESVKWQFWKPNSSFSSSMGDRVNYGIGLKKQNYMQQTSPIQCYWILDSNCPPVQICWKEGWSARLSWRKCWRPWMDPARLKSRGRLKSWEQNIHVDQRWELLSVLLQVFGLKKLLDVWLSENSSQFPQWFVYNVQSHISCSEQSL